MEIASPIPLAGLNALLDRDVPVGDTVPPLGHWLYFLSTAPQSTLGPDGHPKRDDALPPRRMWAGSRIEFRAPIPIGAEIEKHTRILATEKKTGASGEMVFVTELHEVTNGGVLAVREERDVVYRGPGEAPPSRLATPEPAFSRTLTPASRNSSASPRSPSTPIASITTGLHARHRALSRPGGAGAVHRDAADGPGAAAWRAARPLRLPRAPSAFRGPAADALRGRRAVVVAG